MACCHLNINFCITPKYQFNQNNPTSETNELKHTDRGVKDPEPLRIPSLLLHVQIQPTRDDLEANI
jgi:hypothetical protein